MKTTLRVARTPGLAVPSDVEILTSGLLDMWLSVMGRTAFQNKTGYRGNAPATDTSNLPSGYLLVMNKGFGFLATGTGAGARNFGATPEEIFGKLASAVADQLPLVGALAVSVGKAGASVALGMAQANTMGGEIGAALDNPNSFWVAWPDFIEAEHQTVGSFFSRREYLVITAERDGSVQQYCIAPADKYWPGAFMTMRFQYEQNALSFDICLERSGAKDAAAALTSAFLEKHITQPPTDKEKGEIADALTKLVMDGLKTRGVSDNAITIEIAKTLAHFKGTSEKNDHWLKKAAKLRV